MRGTKKLLGILLTLVMLVSMTACGSPTSDTTDGDTQAPVQPEEAPAEEIVLTVFTEQMKENVESDSRVMAFYNAIDTFNAKDTNVQIEVDALATEPYNDKAKILAAGNELPEIFEVLGSWNKSFVESGVNMNLKDIIDADPEWKSIIKPTALNNFTVDGDPYGICLEEGGSTTLLFYNEDILNECGVTSPPTTMAELEDAIVKIKEKGYTPISLGNKGPWVAESCYLSAIGSRYTGNDWNFSIVDHTGAKFTDPEFVQGLALMQNLAKQGAFNSDLNSIDYQQQRVPYYNNEAAMFIEGFWAINSLNSDCPEDVLDATHVIGIPAQEDAKVPDYLAGGSGGWAYELNANLEGPKKDAAVDFLKTLMSQQSARTVLEGGNPCAIDPGEYDKSGLSRLHVEFFDLMAEVPFCETYDLVFDPNVIDVMSKGLQELLIDAVSPEELAERIQAEYEKTSE